MIDPLTLRRALALLLAVLAGCSTAPRLPLPADAGFEACHARFSASDRAIAAATVRDAGAARIPGAPFLRVDRFLAARAAEVQDAAQRSAWLTRAAALDATARAGELARLGAAAGEREALNACRSRLVAALAADDAAWDALRARIAVPDAYATWQRVLGLYPLSARLVLAGVRRLQARETVSAVPPDAAAVRSYALPRPVTPGVALPARDALGMAVPGTPALAALFARHAPQFHVATASAADHIGRVGFDGAGAPTVDPAVPTVYTALSHTRFEGETLLQLSYSVWFPARPRRHPLDLLGGELDAVTWRVTLDRDGEPLAYDTMHNCGCYHMFFPGPRLAARPPADALEEPPWIPFTLAVDGSAPPAIHLAAGTHYVTAVVAGADAPAGQVLRSVPLSELRQLPLSGGTVTSLYDERGLVPASRRLERFVLWPMGIASAGAMRQWGHHATAFVGRRHFDDPDLLQRYFRRRPVTPQGPSTPSKRSSVNGSTPSATGASSAAAASIAAP